MFKRLHSRLLASYAIIILVVLAIVGLALLGFAVSDVRYLPALQRLANVSADARYQIARQLQSERRLPELRQLLTETAESQQVRILITQTGTQRVIYDSDPSQDLQSVPIATLGRASRLFQTQPGVISGLFRHPSTGEAWLVYGQSLQDYERVMVFFAAPAPRPLAFFREYFLRPLCGTGILTFLLAILLALLVSRSIARPLQKLADAATAVSQGNFSQRVTPAGPVEVQQVGSSFNRMADQVQATQQAQRDFVANVSHDLRTPLTAIGGWSQALLDGTADTPTAQQQAASIIHQEAERMGRMVGQLLDLARLESGQFELAREAVDLQALLNDAYRNLARQAEEKSIQFTKDLPTVPAITGDRDRLMQVFTNLLDNALAHTPSGGRVHLVLKRTGKNLVETAVQDSGPGIPREELSRIFERFYQVDKARTRTEKRGTGLGLAIVKELVEAHHGSIQATSTPGKGSTFIVRLPIQER